MKNPSAGFTFGFRVACSFLAINYIHEFVYVLSFDILVVYLWDAAINNDKGPSWGEEQYEKIEQEHHPKWFKPYCSCRLFCVSHFLFCVPMVQNVKKMSTDASKMKYLLLQSFSGPLT